MSSTIDSQTPQQFKEKVCVNHGSTQGLEDKEKTYTHKVNTPSTLKDRRRGSISISRFGQLPESTQSKGLDTPPLSAIAAQSLFYQAQAADMSTTSFASGASDLLDERAYTEDHAPVTEIHQIIGKSRSLSNFLPRRLSRTKSDGLFTPATLDSTLIIGVSIQQSTTEDHSTVPLGTTVTVSAPGSKSHNKPHRRTLPDIRSANWLRTLTQSFKLKPVN